MPGEKKLFRCAKDRQPALDDRVDRIGGADFDGRIEQVVEKHLVKRQVLGQRHGIRPEMDL